MTRPNTHPYKLNLTPDEVEHVLKVVSAAHDENTEYLGFYREADPATREEVKRASVALRQARDQLKRQLDRMARL